MSIQKFLDLSSAYITEQDDVQLADLGDPDHGWQALQFGKLCGLPLPRVIPHAYGYLIHVDQTLQIYQEHIHSLKKIKMSEQFICLMHYARARKCWWLHIDKDGGDLAGPDAKRFKKYDW